MAHAVFFFFHMQADVFLAEYLCDATSYIGLDHPGRGTKTNQADKSIKIMG